MLREEENVLVRRRDEEVADDVFLLEVRDADHAAPAAVLRAERVDRDAFDVAADRDGYHDLGVGDDVFDRELALERLDPRLALVPQALFNVDRLLAHDGEHPRRLGEQVAQVLDSREQPVVFVLDLLPLEADEGTQAHVDDR